jgi:drug/metabolite transporter (DMT)-like permease
MMVDLLSIAILGAMLCGIADTTQLHLAKAMERQGIEIFDQIRAKIKNEHIEMEGKVKKPVIYLVGLVLNEIEPLWLVVANIFGSYPALVTSMFGIGLIFLMLYSVKVLKEPVTRREILGSIIIIVGTLILGFEAFFRPSYNSASVSVLNAILFTVTCAITSAIFVAIVLKTRNARVIGVIFGMVAGTFGGQDILYKLLGQSTGGQTSILPVDVIGWIIFLSSFGIGTVAFLMTQWGFARKAPASVLVPAYDSMYVLIPLLYQVLLLQGYAIWPSTIVGTAMIIIGVILMNKLARKKESIVGSEISS